MESLELTGAVYAIVEILKKAGLPGRFAFLASLIIGIALGFVWHADSTIQVQIMQGLMAGLMASGAYAGAKKVFTTQQDSVDKQIADLIKG